jgi:NAD(P)-dependent dehydrogenase (short-subunit alcohol dehydrogenase family)
MNISSNMAPQILSGKLALVTGAGQGNGLAIALGLAKAGAQVVVTDINTDAVQKVQDEIRAAGGDAWAYVLDVTSIEACYALAAKVGAAQGQLDILVNNAGAIIREGVDSPQVHDNFRKIMDINVNGTFNVTHAWMPALRSTQGSIINLGSIASFTGQPGCAGYAPSKGAVKLLTQSLAIELAKDGVRVNAIAPGVIETPLTTLTRSNPASMQKFMSRTPMGRVGQPEELIGPVIFLASEMSAYVTGITMSVDGGFMAS